jgi:SAM-dependent methyltransferase
MGVKLPRQKESLLIIRFFYLLNRLIPLSDYTKLKLFLNLEWIFDRFSHEYSFKYFTIEEHPIRIYTKKLLEKLISKKYRVLDLGCHEGKMSNYLADIAYEVVGVDNDSKAIENAKLKYGTKKNLQFYTIDAIDYLQNSTDKFDVLILSHILEHIDNPSEFIQNFSKFFNYIYIELPDFDKNYLNHYRTKLEMKLIYTDNDHIIEFDRFEILELLNKNNLTVLEASHIYGIHRIWCQVKK